MARKPLGRGLSALLGEDPVKGAEVDEVEETASADRPPKALNLEISRITANPHQPRKRFDDKALDELAASIRENGVVQPILVRHVGMRFQIVAGERRWRAAQRAGLHRIPAIVKHVEDENILQVALIENIQREELNPIEEAMAYRQLLENYSFTQEQLSERVGKERTLIATALRLLKLPDEIQALVANGKLSAGHGRALLLSDDKAVQMRTARAAIEKQLSVRETERVIKRAAQPPQPADNKGVTQTRDPNVRLAETKMMRALGTNVRIKAGKGGAGKIEIEYYNSTDLDRLFNLLTDKEKPAGA